VVTDRSHAPPPSSGVQKISSAVQKICRVQIATLTPGGGGGGRVALNFRQEFKLIKKSRAYIRRAFLFNHCTTSRKLLLAFSWQSYFCILSSTKYPSVRNACFLSVHWTPEQLTLFLLAGHLIFFLRYYIICRPPDSFSLMIWPSDSTIFIGHLTALLSDYWPPDHLTLYRNVGRRTALVLRLAV